MMSERRTLQVKELPQGGRLAWADVEVLDGAGEVWSTHRELFTLNYEAVSDEEGERLLRQI